MKLLGVLHIRNPFVLMIFVSVVSPTVCEDGRIFCVDVYESIEMSVRCKVCEVRECCGYRKRVSVWSKYEDVSRGRK